MPSCEAAVCAVLPVCCNVAWGDDGLSVSAICVDTAIELCDGLCDFIADGCGDPASGTCCEENGTSFCDDPDCCTDVCLGDPNDPLQPPDSWCCLVEWDTLCKQQATNNALCDCDGEAGDCCVMNFDFPGCDDADCQECVCAADGFCCQFAWGPTCVDLAEGDCLDECGCDHPIPNCPNSNNNCCFAGFDEPGCEDEKCCDLVCAQDAFCCESAWDFSCVDAALKLCDPAVCTFGICPGTIASALPASDTVDARQPFPPSGGSLQGIGTESEPIVITIGETGAGADCFAHCETDVTTSDCCEAHESPGCDDKACANAVCADDGFCCDVMWDGSCAEAAIDACGDLCFGGFGPNAIATVTDNGDGTYTIVLERAIAPNTAAIITYDDGSSVTYISHPANVNADAISNANDVLSLIDILNGVATPPFGNYSGDIDRSGQIGASDVLRTIDLLNGAGALPNQLGGELPGAPNCDDGGGGEGNCCIANGSPGCDDPDCEAAICAADPFCCDVTWDDVCAEDAANEPLCDCG
ncbi:MAG: hypothetical protein IIB61_05100 [Planctomycetes bacterium]|nr:hypothetical protein [Planctomycetota bacterium]